jgi:xanthine dehydrogenase molybdopterin-binding subunit B
MQSVCSCVCNALPAALGCREANPGASFKEVVMKAYLARIDLSAHGFYRTPDVTGSGGNMPFNYYTFGTAVSEVELDCLTGDWQLLRSDVVFDVGNPINPAIDIGQVRGVLAACGLGHMHSWWLAELVPPRAHALEG